MRRATGWSPRTPRSWLSRSVRKANENLMETIRTETDGDYT